MVIIYTYKIKINGVTLCGHVYSLSEEKARKNASMEIKDLIRFGIRFQESDIEIKQLRTLVEQKGKKKRWSCND